jgi:hypothetical protein
MFVSFEAELMFDSFPVLLNDISFTWLVLMGVLISNWEVLKLS